MSALSGLEDMNDALEVGVENTQSRLNETLREYASVSGALRRIESNSRSRTVTPRADTGGLTPSRGRQYRDNDKVTDHTAMAPSPSSSPMARWRGLQELEYLAEAQRIGREVAKLGLASTTAKAVDILRPPRSALSALNGWDIQLHGDAVRVNSQDPNLAYKANEVPWRATDVTVIGNGPVPAFAHGWYYEVIVKRVDPLIPQTGIGNEGKVVLPEDPAGLTIGVTTTHPNNLTKIPLGGSWRLPGTVLIGYDGQISITESNIMNPKFTVIPNGWSPARELTAGRRLGIFIPAHGGVRHRVFLLLDGKVIVRGPLMPADLATMPIWPVVELLGNSRAVTLVRMAELAPPAYQLATCIGDTNSIEEDIQEARVCCQWGMAGRCIRLLSERTLAIVVEEERADEKLPLGGRIIVGNGPVKEFTNGMRYFEIRIKKLRPNVGRFVSSTKGKRWCSIRQKAVMYLSIGYHAATQGMKRIPQVCHINQLPDTNYIIVEHPANTITLSTRIGLLLSREEKILALFIDGHLRGRMQISCPALLDPSTITYPIVDLGRGIWAVSFVANAGPPKEAQSSIQLSNTNNAAVKIQRFIRRRRNIHMLQDTVIEGLARYKGKMELAQQRSIQDQQFAIQKHQLEILQELLRAQRSANDSLVRIARSASTSPIANRPVIPTTTTRMDMRQMVLQPETIEKRRDTTNMDAKKSRESRSGLHEEPSRVKRDNSIRWAVSTVNRDASKTESIRKTNRDSERRRRAKDRKSTRVDRTSKVSIDTIQDNIKDPALIPDSTSGNNDDDEELSEVVTPPKTVKNLLSGCGSFVYPSPWRFVIISNDGLNISRRKGAESTKGNIAIGAEALKRHSEYVSYFFTIKVEALLPVFTHGLAIGVTLTTAMEIKDMIAKKEALPKSAEDVMDTWIVGLRGKMYSPFWDRKPRVCKWSGTIQNGLQAGSIVTLVVGLNGRIYVFVDDKVVDIKCPSGVPRRDGSPPLYPILELSEQADKVKFIPNAELPESIAIAVEKLAMEPGSDTEGSDSESSDGSDSSGSSDYSQTSGSSRSGSVTSRSSSYSTSSYDTESQSSSSGSRPSGSSSRSGSSSSSEAGSSEGSSSSGLFGLF